jgi:hypothetical protein
LTRLLSGEEKTNPLYFEDAFLARDRAEADATAVRGQLAEAVTEQRRWRARCDAAERRAVEAERERRKTPCEPSSPTRAPRRFATRCVLTRGKVTKAL